MCAPAFAALLADASGQMTGDEGPPFGAVRTDELEDFGVLLRDTTQKSERARVREREREGDKKGETKIGEFKEEESAERAGREER